MKSQGAWSDVATQWHELVLNAMVGFKGTKMTVRRNQRSCKKHSKRRKECAIHTAVRSLSEHYEPWCMFLRRDG